MKNLAYLLLVMIIGSTTAIHAGTLDESHPIYALFDNTGWDDEEDGAVHLNRDGNHWVRTGDGRIRPGSWWLDEEGNICIINAGYYEGCTSVIRKDNLLIFVDVNDPSFTFRLEIRPGRDELLTAKQKALYEKLIASTGVIDGGAEFIHLQKNGALSIVQKEGWLKMGGFWFDVHGRSCDNVNDRVDCVDIVSVENTKVVLSYEGDEFELTFRE